MALEDDVQSDPKGALFAAMDNVRVGMLGLVGGGAGLQPMSHFPDATAGVVWFISSTETELVQSLGLGEDADYVVISSNHALHASVRGKLYHLHDEAKLGDLWNPIAASWFEGGKEDPRVALLRFEPETAEIWASTGSTLRFGFEILQATLDPLQQPDLGTKATICFTTAA